MPFSRSPGLGLDIGLLNTFNGGYRQRNFLDLRHADVKLDLDGDGVYEHKEFIMD